MLPALLYYQFDRDRLSTLREKFVQQIFRLDDRLTTKGAIYAKYGALIDEIYGPERRGRFRKLPPGRRAPIFVATVLIMLGWLLVLLNPDVGLIQASAGATAEDRIADVFAPRQTAPAFAFLGAYFFTLFALLRGYVRRDLRPKSYSDISVRIVTVVILAWVARAAVRGRFDRAPDLRLHRRDRPAGAAEQAARDLAAGNGAVPAAIRDGGQRRRGGRGRGRGGGPQRPVAADRPGGDRPLRPDAPLLGRRHEHRGPRAPRPDRADARELGSRSRGSSTGPTRRSSTSTPTRPTVGRCGATGSGRPATSRRPSRAPTATRRSGRSSTPPGTASPGSQSLSARSRTRSGSTASAPGTAAPRRALGRTSRRCRRPRQLRFPRRRSGEDAGAWRGDRLHALRRAERLPRVRRPGSGRRVRPAPG